MIFEDDDGVVLEKEAGILNASLCVRTGKNKMNSRFSTVKFFYFILLVISNIVFLIIHMKVGDLYLENGGKLIENTKIVDVKVIENGKVKLIDNHGSEITCKQLVLCCGAWAGGLLKNLNLELPLHPIRVDVPYWKRSHSH